MLKDQAAVHRAGSTDRDDCSGNGHRKRIGAHSLTAADERAGSTRSGNLLNMSTGRTAVPKDQAAVDDTTENTKKAKRAEFIRDQIGYSQKNAKYPMVYRKKSLLCKVPKLTRHRTCGILWCIKLEDVGYLCGLWAEALVFSPWIAVRMTV